MNRLERARKQAAAIDDEVMGDDSPEEVQSWRAHLDHVLTRKLDPPAFEMLGSEPYRRVDGRECYDVTGCVHPSGSAGVPDPSSRPPRPSPGAPRPSVGLRSPAPCIHVVPGPWDRLVRLAGVGLSPVSCDRCGWWTPIQPTVTVEADWWKRFPDRIRGLEEDHRRVIWKEYARRRERQPTHLSGLVGWQAA
jgi:hypothetical protein